MAARQKPTRLSVGGPSFAVLGQALGSAQVIGQLPGVERQVGELGDEAQRRLRVQHQALVADLEVARAVRGLRASLLDAPAPVARDLLHRLAGREA
jgi:hypothetical protein